MKQAGVLIVRAFLPQSLPEGEGENSAGWSPPERTQPRERFEDASVQSRRDSGNLSPFIAEPSRVATGAKWFARPSGARGILRMETQGCVRLHGLHPGLLSMLPGGANARRLSMSMHVAWWIR